MRWIAHADAASFLAHADAFLKAREEETSLIHGIATGATRSPAASSGWVTVDGPDGPLVAAGMTPPRRAMVTDGPPAALERLCDGWLDRGELLPGVTGPASATAELAAVWSRRTGGDAVRDRHMRLHRLTAVTPTPAVPGALRSATPADIDVLLAWERAFLIDTATEGAPTAAATAARVAAGTHYIWDDGEPRAMACSARPSAHTITINYVYTPPTSRGRGYATACVAALSHLLLATRASILLFTDLANPTSNAIYARIGFQPLRDFDEWAFRPPTISHP